MLAFFIRVIVSLLELVKNPVAWFAKKNWLVKLAFVVLLVPLTSVMAIFWYLQTGQAPLTEVDETIWRQELLAEHEKQQEQLARIKEDLATLTAIQQENVLGVSEDLPAKKKAETQVIYLPQGAKIVPAHKEPSISSAQVGQVRAGNVFYYLEKENDWYLIMIDDQTPAWISDEQLIELF